MTPIPLGVLASSVQGDTPATAVYCSNAAEATASLSTHTFSSMSIGTASGDREVVVAILAQSNSTGRAITSVTIGGVTATQMVTTTGNFYHAALYRAAVPTGTTATVVVNWNGAMARGAIGVWALYGAGAVVSTDQSSGGTSSKTVTVTGAAGGVIFACISRASRQGTFTWTNATESWDAFIASTFTYSGALSTATGSQSITATANASDGDLAMVAAAVA